MSVRVRSLLVLGGAALVLVGATLVARVGDAPAGTLADRAHEIAAGLRCPVCQNLSVADSPSPLAGEMRAEIAAQLRAGRSPEQIRAFFVDRYGEWILLEPTRRGLNLVPWLVPVLGLGVGVASWVLLVRPRVAAPAGATVAEPTRRRIERELEAIPEEPE